MRKGLAWLVPGLLVLASVVQVSASAPATVRGAEGAKASGIPNFSHVFIIVMENHEYGDIIGSSQAPYINSLAKQYNLATQAYGVYHPSLPNYLSLTGGSVFGISDDTGHNIKGKNIVDQLEAGGKTWKAYMEDLPGVCSNVVSSGNYAKKHDPFMFYNDIRNNKTRCNNVVPLTQFAKDMNSGNVPNYVWVTPNLINDMHDGTIQQGDNWLKSFIPQILGSPAYQQGGVIFLTWDEGNTLNGCCQKAVGGHIPMVIMSPLAKAGTQFTTKIDHYSLMRTVEDAWGLGTMRSTGCSCTPDITGIWQ